MTTARVYFNLHKRRLSVQKKTPNGWRVRKHANVVILKNAEFKVSEAGRQRVLKEKKKNVHAVVIGEEVHPPFLDLEKMTRIKKVFYNPYKGSTFVDEDGAPVLNSEIVCICGNKEGYKIFAQIS